MAGLKPLLKDIADAIRDRKNTTAKIVASNFASEIESLQTIGPNVSTSFAPAPPDFEGESGGAYISFSRQGTVSDKSFVVNARVSCNCGLSRKYVDVPITFLFD